MTELISKREMYYHDLIKKNDNIKKDILSIINSETDLSQLNLIHEDKYINGIYADFTCVYNNQIKAIIEVKAADIGVTDYVRGIGQVLQYEYFYDQKISPKGFTYDENFKSILLIPSAVIKDNSFNIGKFKYPNSTLIVEINESSKVARKISEKELLNLSIVDNDNLTSISQYYVRDNRLFEIYMLLRYLCIQKIKRKNQCNRKEVEKELKKTETINNGNWRNAWISVSSLGFIDSNNLPTASGIEIGMLDYEDFIYLIYDSYIKPYIDTLINYLKSDPKNLNKNYQEIIEDIKLIFKNRDVLFLTQSNGRYLSSWFNIIRDDLGAISFETRSNTRKINYNPMELNKSSFIKKVRENSVAHQYIDRLDKII
jgi:hypothetical protein